MTTAELSTARTNRSSLVGFWRACSSAWLCVRRPAFLIPGFLAVAIFAFLMVIGIFLSAARPGGSRITDPPIFIADLAKTDALADLTGGMVSIVGSCVLAVAAAHIAGAFSNGTIRIQLVRQPRRRVWLLGNFAVVIGLSIALAVAAVLAVVVSSYAAAPAYGVNTDLWMSSESLGNLAIAGANLAGSMIGFGVLGAALAVLLRSAVATIGVGLCYGLFENLIEGVFGSGARFLPAANLGALSQGGNANISYTWAIGGSIVVIVLAIVLATEVIQRRDVLD